MTQRNSPENPNKWWVLAAVACGTFMATLDSSIVNIALPTLTHELGTDLSRVKWVVISYLLVITALLLPIGKISDQYGRKKIFQSGYLIFTLGSLLCGVSATLVWLILARSCQAIGAAMLMANGPAIITASFPSRERGKALGILAMVVSGGLISGPSVGGFLITSWGWRSIFLVNLPIGLMGALLVKKRLQADRLLRIHAPFDWSGAFLQMIVLLSLTVIFDPPHISISGGEPFTISRILLAGVAVAFLALFLQVERQAKAPILDLSLLRDRTFSAGNVASFLTFVSFSSLTVMMPFFLEGVMKFSPDRAGLFMTAVPLTIFVVAPISGRLSDQLGSRGLSVLGAMIGAIGLFIMAGAFGLGIHAQISSPAIVLALSSIGLATGLFQSPNNNAIMSTVPHSKLGTASALLATIRNLGLVSGYGLATAIFAWRMRVTHDFVSSLHFVFFVAAVVALGAMAASFARRTGTLPSASPQDGAERKA